MYKVVIADDDFIVRSYLSGLPLWEECGMEVAGTARDGKEALEQVGELEPDILITDLSMPLINGIQLISTIREEAEGPYIIVLSCHDEFEYVKEAMRLGADEYILKNSLEEESLHKTMAATAAILKKRQSSREKNRNGSDYQYFANQSVKYIFFNQLLSGNLAGEERERQRISAQISGTYVNCAVVNLYITQWNIMKTELTPLELGQYSQYFLKKMFKELKRSMGEEHSQAEVVYLGEGNFCCLLDLSDLRLTSQMHQRLTKVAAVALKCSQKEVYPYHIGVSNICMGQTSVRQAVQQARIMNKLSFYLNDGILYYDGDKIISSQLPEEAEKIKQNALSFVKEFREKELIEGLERAAAVFFRQLTDPGRVVRWLKELDHLFQIDRELDFYADITHIDKVMVLLRQYREEVFLSGRREIPSNVSVATKSALLFIHEHYREKISLSDVAEAIHLNSAYLSCLFRREIPLGFSKYLLELRMDTARKLLQNTNYKVKDVAEKSGFYDYHYFTRAFRNLYGCSPLEHRKQFFE